MKSLDKHVWRSYHRDSEHRIKVAGWTPWPEGWPAIYEGARRVIFSVWCLAWSVIQMKNLESRTMERIRHFKKCLHNELLLAAMLLFFLITCPLQTTYTLLHGQIQDRQPDAWSEELICRVWLPLPPCDYTPWLLRPPQRPWRAPVHILKVRIKSCGDYPTIDQSRSDWDHIECLK